MGSLKNHEVLNLATKPCPSARNETENRKAPVTPSCVYVRVCVFFVFCYIFTTQDEEPALLTSLSWKSYALVKKAHVTVSPSGTTAS